MEKSVENETRSKMKRLRLALLGTPLITYIDQPVTFRTRKALALLIYLTAEAVLGQAAGFRQLAEMSGIDEMTGLDALEELTAKRLLLDTNQTDQPYLIAHDKIRELNAPVTEAKILWGLLNFYTPSNRLPQAITSGEQALALAHDFNLREQKAFILNDVAKCYWLSGRLGRARESLREASDLWRELNNLPMLADSLAGSADLAMWTSDYNLALTFSEEAFQISHSNREEVLSI